MAKVTNSMNRNNISPKVRFWMDLIRHTETLAVAEAISVQHHQLVHANNTECVDGCDKAALPGELAAMNEAATILEDGRDGLSR